MKTIKLLLLGTSLSCFPQLAYTQCVVTEDCAALGYTETSCPGNGIKCPFGNGWFCGGDEAAVCDKNGFKYSCTGTGYSGGSGQPCGGKYTSCNCASGYEWKNDSCQKQALNGAQGDLYYCNGAVVAVKTPGMNFYVAMKDIGYTDWDGGNRMCQNYLFCGTTRGSLPTKNQLSIIYNNIYSLNNSLFSNNGIQISDGWYWSSTNFENSHYIVYLFTGAIGSSSTDAGHNYIRCILTSW